jgi:23S rRNA (cytidine1920-2'-O)/16S rRNA (cytidine1409-2'-O)-methyltransferase
MARLDQELVSRGLARSRSHAAQLIAAGRVLRGGQVVLKAATAVSAGQELLVEEAGPDFVSRAGHKLHGALSAFPAVRVSGRRCLDAGASTGGFTDVLLRAGAREVAAVDVGHGQLVPALRSDPRVHVFEGLNVRYLDAAAVGGKAELTVADLSFISLRLVIGPLARATVLGGDLVVMIKPQFEVGRGALNGQGVVTSTAQRRRGVAGVVREALSCGLRIRGLERSTLPGQDGNLEYFLWASVPEAAMEPRIEEDLDRLTDEVLAASTAFGGGGQAGADDGVQ